jgi:hypothetical protein
MICGVCAEIDERGAGGGRVEPATTSKAKHVVLWVQLASFEVMWLGKYVGCPNALTLVAERRARKSGLGSE